MAKWDRHISGQGEKWEVNEKYTECGEWCVIAKDDGVKAKIHWLPKSEYKECEPPEEWEKVEVGIRGSASGILYLKDAPHILNIAISWGLFARNGAGS